MDFGHVFTGILAGGVDIYDDRVETKIITVKRSVPCDVYSFSSSPAANVSDFDGWDSLLFFLLSVFGEENKYLHLAGCHVEGAFTSKNQIDRWFCFDVIKLFVNLIDSAEIRRRSYVKNSLFCIEKNAHLATLLSRNGRF